MFSYSIRPWTNPNTNIHKPSRWNDRIHTTKNSDTSAMPGLFIFPNPTSDAINLVTNFHEKMLIISVYDIHGIKMTEHILSNPDNVSKIDLSKLSTGTYIVKVLTNEMIYYRKIVVVR